MLSGHLTYFVALSIDLKVSTRDSREGLNWTRTFNLSRGAAVVSGGIR